MQSPQMITPSQSYTILRIKRKRTDEPVDTLVIDSTPRRKKSKGGLNVFQFAERVEDNAWNDEQQKKDLEARLTSLAQSSSTKESLSSLGTTSSFSSQAFTPDPNLSFKIVPNESHKSVKGAGSRIPTSPPKVISRKEWDEQQAKIKMFDAIPSSASISQQDSSMDPEVEKFLPMLQEYLKMNDMDTSVPPTPPEPTKDDDYVWDVFYQRPTTFDALFDPNSTLNIGTVSGLPPDDTLDSDSDSEYEDEDDEDSNAEDFYKNDYPEEEDASDMSEAEDSDEFHESSDHEEIRYRDIGDYTYSKTHHA
ncbi:hypothetical protein C8Q75DRAFT_776205 [Abortiporus biennis]|nr:hypothetical protein C8Q75DRAFT_776205 [Abortiporus biennis]